MDIRISPSVLRGTVEIPSSKSCAHRAIICAALSSDSEPSVISGISFSKDIEATLGAMEAFGAKWELTDKENGIVTVYGIGSMRMSGRRIVNCNESGSTLRFVIPIAAALGYEAEFHGRGRLPQRGAADARFGAS